MQCCRLVSCGLADPKIPVKNWGGNPTYPVFKSQLVRHLPAFMPCLRLEWVWDCYFLLPSQRYTSSVSKYETSGLVTKDIALSFLSSVLNCNEHDVNLSHSMWHYHNDCLLFSSDSSMAVRHFVISLLLFVSDVLARTIGAKRINCLNICWSQLQ